MELHLDKGSPDSTRLYITWRSNTILHVVKLWLEAAVANDAELCECLVEQQNDDDEQPNNDSTVEPIVDYPTDIAMDCSDCDNVQSIVDPQATVVLPTDSNNPLLSAMYKLETVASQNDFIIHDVPADGNCMFSAIVYQLNSIGIHVVSQTLRQLLLNTCKLTKPCIVILCVSQ